MFRRFMIVCWVLFALCVVAAAAGWYFGFDANHQREVAQAEYQALQNESVNFYASRLADELSQGEKDEADLSDEERERWTEFLAKEKKRQTVENRLEKLRHQIDLWEQAFLFGSLVGALILLWNIIWHTGHWIWVGRKAE